MTTTRAKLVRAPYGLPQVRYLICGKDQRFISLRSSWIRSVNLLFFALDARVFPP